MLDTLGGLVFFVLLVAALFLPPVIWASFFGYRAALRGRPLAATALQSWLRAVLVVGAVFLGTAALSFLFDLTGHMRDGIAGAGLILGVGLLVILAYLPLIGVPALLAHHCGTARRLREHEDRIEDFVTRATPER